VGARNPPCCSPQSPLDLVCAARRRGVEIRCDSLAHKHRWIDALVLSVLSPWHGYFEVLVTLATIASERRAGRRLGVFGPSDALMDLGRSNYKWGHTQCLIAIKRWPTLQNRHVLCPTHLAQASACLSTKPNPCAVYQVAVLVPNLCHGFLHQSMDFEPTSSMDSRCLALLLPLCCPRLAQNERLSWASLDCLPRRLALVPLISPTLQRRSKSHSTMWQPSPYSSHSNFFLGSPSIPDSLGPDVGSAGKSNSKAPMCSGTQSPQRAAK
jgi:hypothetical protein